MMGFGSYGNGGPYPYSSSSSPSSLSALAPPFTVDRSVAKPISSPLVDVSEPPYVAPVNSSLHNWLPSQAPTTGSSFFANPTPEFNPMPAANAYRYTGLPTVDPSSTNLPPLNTVTAASSNAFTYDQSLNVAATSFVEAKPYYPPYLSPTSHGDTPVVAPDQPTYDWLSASHFAPLDGSSQKDYPQRPSDSKYTASWWGGSWNGPAEWEQGKQGKFDGSFCSKKSDVAGSLPYKSYMNQEPHSATSLNSRDGASHGINTLGWEKNDGAVGDKSLFRKNSKFIPANISKPAIGSLFVIPDTHHKSPSSPFVTKTTNCETPYSVSSERRQCDASLDDIASFSMFSPATGTPRSSEPEKGLFKRVNFKKDASETDNFGVLKPHLPQSSEGKVLFNSSQLGIHLGTKDCFTVESSSARNEELSNRNNNKDAWDHMFKGKPGVQNSHVNPDGFNVALSTNETINSYLSSSDNSDPNNPAVDSPCWKGVPGSRLSPFEASEGGVPEKTKKLEDCDGLHIQMPLMFPLNAGENLSSQKRFKNTDEYTEFGWPENGLTAPFKRHSVANLAFGEHKLDDTAKTTYYSETSLDGGHQSYKDAQKSGHGEKSSGLQQGHGEDGLAIGVKQATQCCGAADVKLNANDTMEYGLSHVPSHAVANMLSSSVEGAATKVAKSNGEESILKVDVQILVNTISSLSELLLLNCSNGSYPLKKNDAEALKAVINNLLICVSKNDEKWSQMQEAPSFQNTSLYNGELSEHHKVVTEERPLSASAPSIQNQFIGSVSLKSDTDTMKENKMTQAIKEILSANFHAEETDPQALLYKNLWLEAEAALCSVNYKARFNRVVKIEMNKCKADKSEDVVKDTTDMMKKSRCEVSHDSEPVDLLTPEAQDCPTSDLQDLPILSQEDDVLARFRILRARVENSKSPDAAKAGESSSKVSPELNKIEKTAPEANGSPSLGISIEDYPSSSKTALTNDDEASVMSRFRIIRDRVENSKVINVVNMEEPSIFQASVEPKTDVTAPDTNDDSEDEFSIQDSPVSMKTRQADDYEASVMSRLHILKSRVDNHSYMHAEGQQLPEPKIGVIAPEASDSLMPEFNIPDSPQANDCEASVMSRLNILKFRADYCSYTPKEGQQQPETADLGYAGMRYPWPIISNRSQGESSDFKVQPILQSQEADNSTGKFVIMKEFHLFAEDDPLPHYHRINRPGNQHDNSSSDWEHVMKEEVWGHNC